MANWLHWTEHNGVSRGVDLDRLESFSIAQVHGTPTIALLLIGRTEPLVVADPVASEEVVLRLQSLTRAAQPHAEASPALG